MNPGGFVLLLGLFAFSEASLSVEKPTISLGEERARPLSQGFRITPEYGNLGKEEWIELIQGTLQGHVPHEILQTENSTFQINETGSFQTSSGNKGSWKMTSILKHFPAVDDGYVQKIISESILVDDVQYARGTVAVTSYTSLDTVGVDGYASTYTTATFLCHKNDSYELFSIDYGAATGLIVKTGEITYTSTGTIFRNITATKEYSVLSTSSEDVITPSKHHNELNCRRSAKSLPLGSPNILETLVHSLKNSDLEPDPASITAETNGQYTLGDTGVYHMKSSYSSSNLKTGDEFTAKSEYNGNYKQLGTQVEETLLPSYEQGLFEIMSRILF